MTANEDSGGKTDSPQSGPVRWWPVWLLGMAAAGTLAWIWGWYGVSRQDKNIATAQVVVCTVSLLLLWLIFFSLIRHRLRWMILGSVVVPIVLVATLFRIRGVTGDLVPVLESRWRSKRTPAPEAAVRAPENAVVKTSAYDYPQFLGPHRNANVAGPKLAHDWSAHPPAFVWRRPIGAAWSGFAIVGDHAVTQEQRDEEELVVCYDLFSGKIRWSHGDQARYHTTIAGEGPRATPTIVSNRVYSLGATGILNCLDLGSGKRIWSKDIIKDNQGHVPEWGLSGSPLVVDHVVVVSAGGREGRSLVAYDTETGELVWGGGNDGIGYSSPCLATLGGVRQILIFNAHGLAAHAVDSGQVLWEYPWPGGHPHVAIPVVLPEDQVLVSSGYGTGSELLSIETKKGWLPRRMWKSIRLKAKFTNLVWRAGHLYGLDDGILVCLDASNGTLKWKEGRYGHGQVILSGDLLLLMAESGQILLLEPVPEAHRRIGAFQVLGGKTWNPPALAGEYLLVRNDKEAACYRIPIRERQAQEGRTSE